MDMHYNYKKEKENCLLIVSQNTCCDLLIKIVDEFLKENAVIYTFSMCSQSFGNIK